MSNNATEIATFAVPPGSNLEDPNSASGTVWQECLTTVLDQEGAQRAYWGRQVEDLSMMYLFVDWDSVDAHKKFIAQPYYEAFFKRFGTLIDSARGVNLVHANLTPHPATAALSNINAPATEILTVYFPKSYSQSDQDKFEKDVQSLISVIEKNAPEAYKGSAGGWIVEDVDNEKAGGKSSAKAYFAAVGWQSVEAHHKFREHQVFKDNIHLLRGAKDLQDLTVAHASLLEIQGGLGAEERGESNNAQEEILNPQNPGSGAPKTAADGSTSKNDPGVGGVSNSAKKERSGRGQ